MPTVGELVLAAFRFNRDHTTTSPLYRRLLGRAVEDIERGGPCAEVVVQMPPDVDPIADALPLRFLGGLHRIALVGRAPDLAASYASAGGSYDPDDPGDIDERFLAAVAEHRDELVVALGRGVQTNEVGRCSPLLLGFLAVARDTGLPLRILEVGASAGLNLRWDRYRYEDGADGSTWGDPASPLRFEGAYVDPLPDLDVDATVVERGGCDRNPIDISSSDGVLTLRSFLWPDQPQRFAAFDAAVQLAPSATVRLERADAGDWVEAQLATPQPGTATVLYHSIVWQYLPTDSRRRVKRALERAGESATPDAPVAWLRMEPGQDPTRSAEVTLRQWPDGRGRLVALTGYHGRPVRPIPDDDHPLAVVAERPTSR